MKQLLAFIVMLLSASMLYAQDIITPRSGETINGKVSEVGINKVKYYKSSNLQGPVYVAAKADISQIVYENGSKEWLYPVVSTHIDLRHHGSYYGGHHGGYFGGHHGGRHH